MTDRRTDRQTEFSSLDRVCIPCSAVKIDDDGGDDEFILLNPRTHSATLIAWQRVTTRFK